MESDFFRKKPHEDFVQRKADNPDQGKYAEFNSPVGKSVDTENPGDAQNVVDSKPKGESQPRRYQIMDAKIPGEEEKRRKIQKKRCSSHERVPEKLNHDILAVVLEQNVHQGILARHATPRTDTNLRPWFTAPPRLSDALEGRRLYLLFCAKTLYPLSSYKRRMLLSLDK